MKHKSEEYHRNVADRELINDLKRVASLLGKVSPKIILHVDHVMPYSKGGETVLENLQTLCLKWNIGKSNL